MKTTAKEIWDALKRYQGSTKVKKVHLPALRLEYLKMKESETVDEFMSRSLAVVNKMTIHGEEIEQFMVKR